MKITLLRHPRLAIEEGVCYGASDVPLPDSCELPAIAVPPATLILSSPLSRCLRFARTLGDVVVDARLAEMDFGAWEMRRYSDIGMAALDQWAADPLHFRPPGGESVADMRERVLSLLQEVLAQPRDVLILSHGGPLRVIAGELLGLPPAQWTRLAFAHALPLVVERMGETWRAPAELMQQLQ